MPASTLFVVPLVVQFLSPFRADESDALLTACTLAHERGTCTASPGAPEGALRATVEESSPDHVLVEVAGAGETGHLFASREITFEPKDEPLERARSIGLTLGVLATSLLLSQQDSPPGQEEEKEEHAPSAPRRPPSSLQNRDPFPRAFFGLGGGAVSSPTFSAPGPGASAFARLRLGSTLAVAARVDGWAGSLHAPPRLFVLTPTVSLGAFASVGSTLAGGGLYSGIEILRADIQTDGGHIAHAARSSPLVGVTATFGAPLLGSLWVFATPRVSFALSPTELYVNGENAGKIGVVRLGLFLEFALAVGHGSTVDD